MNFFTLVEIQKTTERGRKAIFQVVGVKGCRLKTYIKKL